MFVNIRDIKIIKIKAHYVSVEGGGACCRRPQNEQICLSQNAYSYITVLKTEDLIFAGAVDL